MKKSSRVILSPEEAPPSFNIFGTNIEDDESFTEFNVKKKLSLSPSQPPSFRRLKVGYNPYSDEDDDEEDENNLSNSREKENYSPNAFTQSTKSKTQSTRKSSPKAKTLTTEEKREFNKFILQAREMQDDPEKYEEVRSLYLRALKIFHNPKLDKKIEKLDSLIRERDEILISDEEEEEEVRQQQQQREDDDFESPKNKFPRKQRPNYQSEGDESEGSEKSESEGDNENSNASDDESESEEEPVIQKKAATAIKPIKPIQRVIATSKSTTKKIPQRRIQEDSEDESLNRTLTGEKDEELKPLQDGYYYGTTNKHYYLLSKEHDSSRFFMPNFLYDKLFDYQKEGIKWMWNLHQRSTGGILGDEMGLGKTLQVSAFLSGLLQSNVINTALIVMPVSVMEQWKNEILGSWSKPFKVLFFHGKKSERDRNLNAVVKNRGFLITTYNMVLTNYSQLNLNGTHTWDYVVLDEGHKIKNDNKTGQAIHELKTKHKLLLTGTPIMNNLMEMWALFDWTLSGNLLGDKRSFKTQFEQPIVKGADKGANTLQKQKAIQIADNLRSTISPYFLRRLKKDVKKGYDLLNNNNNVEVSDILQNERTPLGENVVSKSGAEMSVPSSSRMFNLTTRKNDLIIWIKLTPVQMKLYKLFLESQEVKDVLNQTKNPLVALTVMKKICDHPLLLHDKMKMCEALDLENVGYIMNENDQERYNLERCISASYKMQFLASLLPNLKEEGHRMLIFSQSKIMLNVIQEYLVSKNFRFLRIDGDVIGPERQKRINMFNQDSSYFCFLLTIQVGALGINLTSADRVLIFDPAWSTVDNQAVDRVYRYGQTRNVVVYRLVTCGTIEERIYRRQVFKGSLMNAVMEKGKNYRYFYGEELYELFTLDESGVSTTQLQLQQLYANKRKTDNELDCHLEFLHTLGISGVSDHDLLFTEECDEGIEGIEGIVDAMSEISLGVNAKYSNTTTKRIRKKKPQSKNETSQDIIDLTDKLAISLQSNTENIRNDTSISTPLTPFIPNNNHNNHNHNFPPRTPFSPLDSVFTSSQTIMEKLNSNTSTPQDNTINLTNDSNSSVVISETPKREITTFDLTTPNNNNPSPFISIQHVPPNTSNESFNNTNDINYNNSGDINVRQQKIPIYIQDDPMIIKDSLNTSISTSIKSPRDYQTPQRTPVTQINPSSSSSRSNSNNNKSNSSNIINTPFTPFTHFTKMKTPSPKKDSHVNFCCEIHKISLSPFISRSNCSCNLTQQQNTEFTEKIQKGVECEESGDLLNALKCYTSALDICDSDISLHNTILKLSQRCGVFDRITTQINTPKTQKTPQSINTKTPQSQAKEHAPPELITLPPPPSPLLITDFMLPDLPLPPPPIFTTDDFLPTFWDD